VPESLRVTAPASSANLGPGFDCLAVALELRNEVDLRRSGDGEVRVVASGEGGDRAGGRDNLFVRAFEHGGGDPAGIEFTMINRIPFARGLGSSAATIAAGLIAAEAWLGREQGDLLGPATELEGHPDNVAAALNGGVTLAWIGEDGPAAIGFGDPGVEFVVVVAAQELATEAARAALPESVPHADATHTAARAALLVAALAAGDSELIGEALDDRLHEPYRAPLVPLLGAVREQIDGLHGALGATISGAGPSVLVWCEPEHAEQVAAELDGLRGAQARALEVADEGVTVEG
jgi:homoserine kinase